eukprot:Platyproteum_vivax@DN6259_c1_g1_i2.p1
MDNAHESGTGQIEQDSLTNVKRKVETKAELKVELKEELKREQNVKTESKIKVEHGAEKKAKKRKTGGSAAGSSVVADKVAQIDRKRPLQNCGALRYERIDFLGKGTYGTVNAHRDLQDPNSRVVAIKRIASDLVDKRTGIDFTALREIKLMREVKHPNVAGLHDVYADGLSVCLVMDYLPTDLGKILQDKSLHLSESNIKCIITQVLTGLVALHEWQFLHRDLSPANVMFDHEGTVKLGDFGLSRSFGSPMREMSPRVVTIYYRAPELLFGAPYYGSGVDVWACGCILAELLMRQPLFFSSSASELATLGQIFQLLGTPSSEDWPEMEALPWYCEFEPRSPKKISTVLPETTPLSAMNLLSQMLVLNPAKRISASDALRHPYFMEPPLACSPKELAKSCRIRNKFLANN